MGKQDKPSYTQILKQRVAQVKRLKAFKRQKHEWYLENKAKGTLPSQIAKRNRVAAKKVKVKNQKKNEDPEEKNTPEAKAERKRIHEMKLTAKRMRRQLKKEAKQNKKTKKMAGIQERIEKRRELKQQREEAAAAAGTEETRE